MPDQASAGLMSEATRSFQSAPPLCNDTALKEERQTRSRDVNLFYDPATGYNKDPTIYGRPNPTAGTVQLLNSGGETETVLVSSSFTRRFDGTAARQASR